MSVFQMVSSAIQTEMCTVDVAMESTFGRLEAYCLAELSSTAEQPISVLAGEASSSSSTSISCGELN